MAQSRQTRNGRGKSSNSVNKKRTRKTVKKQENNRAFGVLCMFLGILGALWFVTRLGVCIPSATGLGNFLAILLSGICNIAIACFLVYGGLLTFLDKSSHFSRWQVLGWILFCFGVTGLFHLDYWAGGGAFIEEIKQAFLSGLQGQGGGLIGFAASFFVSFISSSVVQHVVLWACILLGLMLGTDMKIFGFVKNCISHLVFEDDPEKQAEKASLKAQKKEEKALAKAALAEKKKQTKQMEQPVSGEFVSPPPIPKPKQEISLPPLITDYSGKAFEEITDYDAVTVGDLLADDLYFQDPEYVRHLMPRVSAVKSNNAITEQELERMADAAMKNQQNQDSIKADEMIPPEEVASIEPKTENLPKEPVNLSQKETSSLAKESSVVHASQGEKQGKAYRLPPIDLLKGGGKGKKPRLDQQMLDKSAALEAALASFGVKTKVVEVVCGPAVIRYELQPAPGVKVSKIVNLADDIALALAARSLRIEAPVPGKSVVGIEIAKSEVTPVYFKDVLRSEAFQKSKSKLSIAFGVDINGSAVVGNLADMPHLLIAGATGSGKSVCMNTLICSILFKAKPDEVKIIMVDPKKVELTNYNGLPHLGRPVVTDAKKAATVLREVVNEMERRYTLFASVGVKNFQGFNALPDGEKMPQIVVLIDELADLMMVASHDVEDAICRLAQMARAAGIHLVIATQRPSVDVITGLIKANVPSRIAFAVSSQIDSRTILDMGGAEKLLGKGDMLYFPIGFNKPVRVQGAFLSETEIEQLVDYCRQQANPEFLELPAEEPEEEKQEEQMPFGDDELFLDACQQVILSGQASASSLQRRFRIGYNRAARLIDTMEELHIISPPEGNKRTVLMGQEMFAEMFLQPKQDSQAENTDQE